MRLHSDLVTVDDVRAAAATVPHVSVGTLTEHGSRKRDHAFEVTLSGTGVYGGAYGSYDGHVATWDEWGLVLAELYRIDPNMAAGPYPHNRRYELESFDWHTVNRFRTLLPQDMHARHRWSYAGTFAVTRMSREPGAPLRYSEQECTCGARRRWVVERVPERTEARAPDLSAYPALGHALDDPTGGAVAWYRLTK